MSDSLIMKRTDPDDVLAGGGEMGALMRSMDWSKTPLGPVEDWPQSLRTTVKICLASRFPILIWWGPELVKIYNDAYRPMLGDKHPRSMGARGRDVWPEIWHIIGPMLEGVLAGGEATWSENQLLSLERHGFAEECYFTFSYSPIRAETGEVGGVFSAVAETTGQVIGERRLRVLQEIARRTADARTAEEACNSTAPVFREDADDLPFALLYLLERDGARARLAAAAGLAAGHRLAPEIVDLATEGAEAPWPLAEVAGTRTSRHIPKLDDAFGSFALPKQAASRRSALVLPVGRPADPQLAGILVAGISNRLRFDDNYGTFLSLVAGQIATAVSNARALEEAQQRAEALAELDRSKTLFFSNVSHEFRTPLTLMIGPTQDALSSPGRALHAHDLDMVYRNELRLLKLVNTLLDFSRIEAGRAEAVYEPTDLAALTADLASAFRSTIERGGLRFEVDCGTLPKPVYVDREMWEKVVLNLLSNAFKFTFAGRIRVALRAAHGHVELEVEDTGVGIPEHELPRLFERFHRIQGTRSRTYEGSGIGLALVKNLVELHGGKIRVTSTSAETSTRSEAGEGGGAGPHTTFTVSIPFGTAHLPAGRIGAVRTLASTATRAESFVAEASRWLPAPAAHTEPAPPNLRQPLRYDDRSAPTKLLIVDDNADMRDYLARLLRPHWGVETAADGVEALASIRDRTPDLVLADVMMPNLDGFGLLRALRAGETTREIPVVLLSARAGEEARIEGLDAGADDYLVKPFSARELVARIGARLALTQIRRERADLLKREHSARQEAELQKQHLAALFMQAPTPIVILRGNDYVIELANPFACRLWGRKHEDVIDRPLFEALPEIREQAFKELLDGVLRTGESYIGKEKRTRLDWHSDGTLEERYLNFVYAPLRNLRGDIDGVLVIAFDVTDEVLARKQMNALRAEAEVASRAKDEFLAMLGHELRNPLAPILTTLQLMRLRRGDGLEKERAIIERQAEQLVRLIDDLLDVSRITRGKIELKRERVELAEVVAKAIETAGPLLEQRKHQLTVNVPRDLVVDGDAARLTQVIVNLLTNAAKYTEHAGRVTVDGARNGDEAVLHVCDSGIGMSPELLPKIFNMFTQERQPIDRSQGGLGLGLAIVRSLVEMHGGNVTAHSRGNGFGSTFSVRLPAAAPLSDTRAEAISGNAGEERGSSNGQRRVLVVDDNEDAADSLAEYVEAIGHRARVAHDGPAALRIAAEFAPEVALVDIGLPLLDGYELARRMREQPELRDIRLVAVTGYGQKADRQRARYAGFDEHLVKPVDLDRLRSLLDEHAAPRV
jgi:PAS domain S-box-containing protein